MKIVKFNLKDLKLDVENINVHDDANIDYIADSLNMFGQQKPIVVRQQDNVIVAGNGTYLAAKRLNWSEIDGVYSELDKKKSKAFSIADNQIGKTSYFDLELLGKSLIDLESEFENNWGSLGFESGDVQLLLSASENMGNNPDHEGNMGEGLGDSNEDKPKMIKINVTNEQYETISTAISAFKAKESVSEVKEGRILELICADWMAGI